LHREGRYFRDLLVANFLTLLSGGRYFRKFAVFLHASNRFSMKKPSKNSNLEIQDLACQILKIEDLACQILKIQDLEIQDLACQMLKIQDLACQILKIQDLACQILKIQDLEIQDLACPI